jgi:hypothetical protein
MMIEENGGGIASKMLLVYENGSMCKVPVYKEWCIVCQLLAFINKSK